jgi:hypothetical protein
LGSLGTSLDRGTNNQKYTQNNPPIQNQLNIFLILKCLFLRTEHRKNPILKQEALLDRQKQLEGTEEQTSADQNEEGLEISHKHKSSKSHKKIRKLKK